MWYLRPLWSAKEAPKSHLQLYCPNKRSLRGSMFTSWRSTKCHFAVVSQKFACYWFMTQINEVLTNLFFLTAVFKSPFRFWHTSSLQCGEIFLKNAKPCCFIYKFVDIVTLFIMDDTNFLFSWEKHTWTEIFHFSFWHYSIMFTSDKVLQT